MAKARLEIQGTANFSAISKEVQALQRKVQDAFGPEGAKVLDEEALVLFNQDATVGIEKVQKELKKLKKDAADLAKEQKKALGDEKKQAELMKQRHELAKKILETERALRKEKEVRDSAVTQPALAKAALPSNVVPIRGGKHPAGAAQVARAQILGGLSHVGSELPGIAGPAMSIGSTAVSAGKTAAGAGMSTEAIVGLGALGAVAGIAAVSIGRMVSGFEAYKQVVPQILGLSGMGVQTAFGRGNRAVRGAETLGYDQGDVLGVQTGLNRAFGRTSAGGDQNRILNTLIASRGLGLSPDQITGGGNQLRAMGGTAMAQREMGQILEKAVSSGMDKTQASAYLGAAVGLLSELNQDGISNTTRLLSTLAGLTAKGNMSPEMAARSLGGLSGAIAGSSGEANAFFQQAAVRAGLGGGTLLGTQFAVRQGLAGVDAGALGNQVGDTRGGRMGMRAIHEMGLDSGDFSKKFADSILHGINDRFNTKTAQGRQGALGFVGNLFGSKSAGEATKALALLEKIAQGSGTPADKKMLADMTKDPAEAWREKTLADLDQTARYTAETAAGLKNGQIDLGKDSSKGMNELTQGLIKLDATLDKLVASLNQKGLFDTLKNMEESLHEAALQFVTDIGNGVVGAIKSFLGITDDAEKAAVNGAIPNKLSDSDKSSVEKFFGVAPGTIDKQRGATAGAAPGGDASTGHLEDIAKESKKTNALLEKVVKGNAFAPKAGRDPSRP